MKRRFTGVLATALVAASLGLTPMARATDAPPWPLNCGDGAPTRPTLGTVYTDSTGLHVNVDAPPDDIAATRQWAVDVALHFVACWTSPVPWDDVACYSDIATNITRYVNVDPPQIDVYYPALAQDLAACALEG